MVAVSKEESMLLIQHAISAYLNEGKNQTDLGELLGLATPRISEYKVGKGRLSPNQRNIIIDNYGYPRRGKGQYIKAEVYDTVTEFIDDYEDSSKKRLKRRLYELLMRKDYQDVILSYLQGKISPTVYIGKGPKEPEKREELMRDISVVEKLLSQPETKIWYENHSKSSFKLLLDSVDTRLDKYIRGDFDKILYRIAQFKFELMPDFSFHGDIDVPSISRKEMIITGDEVLNFKADCRRVEFNKAADLFGDRNSLYDLSCPCDSYRSVIQEGSEINAKPDNWERIILRLYLSESMHYHLWIRLDDVFHINEADLIEERFAEELEGIREDGLVRNIVIKDLCRNDFLNEIEIIRKWCGWPYDFNDDIKREVAKVGGYVPGAEVL